VRVWLLDRLEPPEPLPKLPKLPKLFEPPEPPEQVSEKRGPNLKASPKVAPSR
jgi:hypothetical protein